MKLADVGRWTTCTSFLQMEFEVQVDVLLDVHDGSDVQQCYKQVVRYSTVGRFRRP